jgi:hypothetical protein
VGKQTACDCLTCIAIPLPSALLATLFERARARALSGDSSARVPSALVALGENLLARASVSASRWSAPAHVRARLSPSRQPPSAAWRKQKMAHLLFTGFPV